MTSRLKPPLRILIVEDEPLLAMDIEFMVENGGHEVVAEAASLYEVESLENSAAPDVAFVDIHLAQGTSGLDVNQLIQKRWPQAIIVFVTANPKKIPDDFAGAHGVIAKPFTESGFASALRYLEEGLCNPPPSSTRPGSFVASPALSASWP